MNEQESIQKDKIKTSKFSLYVLLALVVGATIMYGLRFRWQDAVVTLNQQELHVLVAKIPYHHFKGLGGRESLGKYDGMLFLFTHSHKATIVMRDMHFPLDIVWIDDGVVVDMAPNVQTEPGAKEFELRRYAPRVSADIVIELPAGWIDEHKLEIGHELAVIRE